jgi:hypothetical protein
VRPGLPHEVGARPRLDAHADGRGCGRGRHHGRTPRQHRGFLFAPLFVVVLHRGIKDAFGLSLRSAPRSRSPARSCTPPSATSTGPWSWLFGAASIPLSYVGARVALRTHSVKLERLYGAVIATLGITLLVVMH